jgi:VWFA-related protein
MRRSVVCAVVLTGAVLTAQTPGTPQFKSGIDLVHLDVSVLDKNRRPVKGLTALDFTILEDGKPQAVAAFSAIDLPDPVPPSTPWMRDVAPDVRSNAEFNERRLIAIVMDDATIPFQIQMIKSAREIGRLVVDRLGPNDMAAVIFTRDNRNAQEFTNDRARLLKAIDSFEYGGRNVGLPPQMPAITESLAFQQSVGTIMRVAGSLTALSQRRKAVVYVTVGVPVDAAIASEPVLAGSGGGATETGAIFQQLMNDLTNTYRKAHLASVNIYTVSPAGVGGMFALIESERFKGNTVPPYETPANYLDFLVGIAENTGGRAFPERNEFASALDQVFVENGSYYLVGYAPPNPKADGKFRRVEVKVNRPNVTVRSRNGYYSDKAAEARAAAEAPPLTAALAGLLPKADVGLDVTAASFAIPARNESGVVVVLTVHQEAPARASRTSERVDLQISAFTQEGAARGGSRYETTVTLRPGPAGPVEYEVLSSLVLKPGRYQLRLSAHVGAQGKTGSVYYDIDVPDFAARPLSLSGLLLTSDPRPVSTNTDRIKAYVPVSPTARRVFRADSVSAFARVYQGGTTPLVPVQMTVTVTDAQGAVRIRRTESLAKDLFGSGPSAFGPGDRSADFGLVLPLKSLNPGDYLLTLEAASGRGVAKREVRFKVQ